MTKQELSKMYWLNREKKMWQHELDRLKNQSLVGGQGYTTESFANGSSTSGKQEIHAANKDEIESMIKELQQKIDEEEKKMMQYILTIDDSLLRQIIHYRCVCLLPWDIVAKELGGGNTADGVRMKFKRFLEKK